MEEEEGEGRERCSGKRRKFEGIDSRAKRDL